MELDLEYSNAVNNLQLRQCTPRDIELFNSHLIKNNENANGIDMGLIENFDAISIVSTNSLQTAINFHKAICKTNHSPELITCAALDTVNSDIVPPPQFSKLLEMDVSAFLRDGALPSFIPLYTGFYVLVIYQPI